MGMRAGGPAAVSPRWRGRLWADVRSLVSVTCGHRQSSCAYRMTRVGLTRTEGRCFVPDMVLRDCRRRRQARIDYEAGGLSLAALGMPGRRGGAAGRRLRCELSGMEALPALRFFLVPNFGWCSSFAAGMTSWTSRLPKRESGYFAFAPIHQRTAGTQRPERGWALAASHPNQSQTPLTGCWAVVPLFVYLALRLVISR